MFSIDKLVDLNRTRGFVLVLTALLIAIAGEIKVVPFDEADFRFGLGSVIFLFIILIYPPVSIIRTGIVTGITVVCFRLVQDLFFGEVLVWTSLKSHMPAFLFYFLFAFGLHTVRVEKYKTYPLKLGGYATLFELIGNGVEQLTRSWSLHQTNLSLSEWSLISAVAFVRSFFVVGLYSSITVSEQKKQMQEMLKVGSELYAETIYLQKSMNHIEQITASSHDLYRRLKKQELNQLSVQALQITQQIHEVKKDCQRILAGLAKLAESKRTDQLLLSDVLNLVVTANEKYSELLNKKITFNLHISTDFETDQQIALLAIMNNLTANAVEAIMEKGEIVINIFKELADTCFVIEDSGPGIAKEDLSIIFAPGYTTKFNGQGVAATGIGLSHVRGIVDALEGQIQVESSANGTVFCIQIPTKQLRKRDE